MNKREKFRQRQLPPLVCDDLPTETTAQFREWEWAPRREAELLMCVAAGETPVVAEMMAFAAPGLADAGLDVNEFLGNQSIGGDFAVSVFL